MEYDNISNGNETFYYRNYSFVNSGSFKNPFHDTAVKALFITCYVAVFITCIIGNTVVLFAIARSPRLRSMTNFFLANLAVADFCVGVFCVLPNLSTFLSQNWILGRVMCKIYYYVWNVSYTTSIGILTVVAVERYIAIIHPLKAKHLRRRKNMFLSCMLIWTIAIVYNTPYLIYYDTISLKSLNIEFCYFSQDDLPSLKGLSLANLIMWFITPLLVIAIMYCKVGTRLWNRPMMTTARLRGRNSSSECPSPNTLDSNVETYREQFTLTYCSNSPTEAQQTASETANNHKTECREIKHKATGFINGFRQSKYALQERKNMSYKMRDSSPYGYKCQPRSWRKYTHERRKIIRLLIAIVVSFAACVFPHHLKVLNHFWNIVHLSHTADVYISPISFIILYLNSVLNPILYALFSANFRKAVKESFCCFPQQRRKKLYMSQRTKNLL